MKSTRLVLGALVVTLHVHQPIQSAASEPVIEYPDCNASAIFPEKPHAPLRDAGWKRVSKGVAASRWEQFANIPQDQHSNTELLPYLTQSSETLSSDIADAIQHASRLEYQIECAKSELARITKEKEKMEEVAKRRLVHTFSAYNMSLGITKFDDQKRVAFLAKKIADKNNERAIIEHNLAQYLSGIVQKHNEQRATAIEAFWEPTKEMNALSYGLYWATYGMSAPSPMTIDEALQTEFEHAGKEQVATLITYAKTLWPTLQDVLVAPAAVSHDITSQELTVRTLEEKISKANNPEEKQGLATTLATETKKLHALKLLRFNDLNNCKKSISDMSNRLTGVNQQIFALEQNAEIAKENVQALLGIVLYDARARGLDVPTAIAHSLKNVSGMHPKDTHDVIEFLTVLYEENKNPDDIELTTEKEPVATVEASSKATQHFLTRVLTKKAAGTARGKMNRYHKHLTQLALEPTHKILTPAIKKKCEDIKTGTMSEYAQYLKTYKPVTHNKSNEDQVKSLEAFLASKTASRFEAIQSLCKAEESEEGTMTEPESASSSSSSESESESEDESESESDDDSATDSDEDTESEAPENN